LHDEFADKDMFSILLETGPLCREAVDSQQSKRNRWHTYKIRRMRLYLPLKSEGQGCQIFLGTAIQNGNKYTKRQQNISNCRKLYQLAVK
jgi:hypothetical protein